MNLYRYDENLKIIDFGEYDYNNALLILEECYQKGLEKYKWGEKAMSETCFGLSRSDKDFIDICCNGQDTINVFSDRIYFPSMLSRIFSYKKHFSIESTKNDTIKLMKSYFENKREIFEQKYAKFLCRR